MDEKTNYGKIIAVTLSLIAIVGATVFSLCCLLQNLIAFCAVYDEPKGEEPLCFDEIEEAPLACGDLPSAPKND